VALCGTVFASASNLTERVNELETESSTLKVKNTNLEAQLKQSRAAVERYKTRLAAVGMSAASGLDGMAPPATGMQPAVKTVRVERGDTLSKIVSRVYGDGARWKDLLQANRNILRRAEDVRPGQVLIVP